MNDTDIIKLDDVSEQQTRRDLTKSLGKVKPRPKIKFFHKDEILSLLAGVPVGKERAFFQFLWMTGCRVTEAITLTRAHIDFKNDELTIRWQKSRKFKERVIPMHRQLKEILLMYSATLLYDKRLFPWTRQNAYYMCTKYGFGNPHKLRHSYAVHFIRSNKDPSALVYLQTLLGHSNIRTTTEYLNFVPQHIKPALDSVDYMTPTPERDMF
ncbi:MAG: hypothetical protein DRI46_12695 [Chloroflexi bacterium]|nr:MAG: hypothetical protein DRI46_12695 [Chloroflexota bacterium]